jgi:hypothetical protein
VILAYSYVEVQEIAMSLLHSSCASGRRIGYIPAIR